MVGNTLLTNGYKRSPPPLRDRDLNGRNSAQTNKGAEQHGDIDPFKIHV